MCTHVSITASSEPWRQEQTELLSFSIVSLASEVRLNQVLKARLCPLGAHRATARCLSSERRWHDSATSRQALRATPTVLSSIIRSPRRAALWVAACAHHWLQPRARLRCRKKAIARPSGVERAGTPDHVMNARASAPCTHRDASPRLAFHPAVYSRQCTIDDDSATFTHATPARRARTSRSLCARSTSNTCATAPLCQR